MNCLECQELLQTRLDGAHVPSSLALDQHLAGCQSCRHYHAGAAMLLEGLNAVPAEQPPADLAGRIVASVLRDRLLRRQRMRRRVWVTASLAAAILLMAWAGNTWLPRRNGQEVVKHQPAPPAPHKMPHEVPVEVVPLAQSVDEVRNDVIALGNRLADQTRDQARLFAAVTPPMEIPSFPTDVRLPMEEPLDPAAQSLIQAGQGVSQGLGTVSNNARRAVDFFAKELPIGD